MKKKDYMELKIYKGFVSNIMFVIFILPHWLYASQHCLLMFEVVSLHSGTLTEML